MKRISRFIPEHEKEKYSELFTQTTFTDVLNKLNLGEPEHTDIVKDTYLAEDGVGTETNKLMSFGNTAKVILKRYHIEMKENKRTADIVDVWVQREDNVIFQQYSNGELTIEKTMDTMADIYADYQKTVEIPEENEAHLAEIAPTGFSCIRTGSCCFFDGVRYEHCGQTCGNYNNAGGGTPINYVDSCCTLHDRDIQGPNPIGICEAHWKFMNCSAGQSGPGVNTIRLGIALDISAKC